MLRKLCFDGGYLDLVGEGAWPGRGRGPNARDVPGEQQRSAAPSTLRAVKHLSRGWRRVAATILDDGRCGRDAFGAVRCAGSSDVWLLRAG